MYHFKYGRFRFNKVIIFSLYMTFFENMNMRTRHSKAASRIS